MSDVLVLQHALCETLGTITSALESVGIAAKSVRTFAGEPVPAALDGAAGLIVMGGPMGVYDYSRYPFLREEMRLIERALKAAQPVLGVCLGSQLLAAVLGASVTPGKGKEIGWYPVTLTASVADDLLWMDIDSPFTAFHWHGDVFDLPRSAVSLASSALTVCQGFRYRYNAYGLLFHLEMTERIVQEMVQTFSDELREAQVDGAAIVASALSYLPSLHRIGEVVFRRWATLVGG